MKDVLTPELVSKYYKFPFRSADGMYVWDSDGNMCLDRPIEKYRDSTILSFTILVLNGLKEAAYYTDRKFTLKDGEILLGEEVELRVRGWGRLQYIKEDSPELIQDTFAQWVVDKLNNSIKPKET